MTDYASNNRRIAKNTLFLYFRMIITMLVSLFTSRVILDALGEDNYGIYNVVGGFVAMFSIFSGPLSAAIQRFMNFELGKNDIEKLKQIFSTSVNIQIFMAIILGILCEIIGIWFINEKMTIPQDRIPAAFIVLQFSIATFAINLISVPYNADIIAHEKMNAFAYISIVEVFLKLGIAYCIYITRFDKLVFYSFLLFLVALIVRIIYGVYSKRHFPEAQYSFVIDKSIAKEMTSFAMWNLFGNTAWIFNTQGINLLVNAFFGLSANAARAIADQVNSAVNQFVNNFTTAINPQITKSYAIGDYDYLYKLNFKGIKYSFFIYYILIVPIVIEADTILSIWLKQVPNDTVVFLRLVLFASIASVIGNPLYTTILATGKIRRYQITVTTIGITVFPLSWIAYKFGAPAYVSYIIYGLVYFILDLVRLAFLKQLINFPVRDFLKNIYLRIFLCAISCLLIPIMILFLFRASFLRLLLTCIVSVVWSSLCIYLIGLDKHEKKFLLGKLKTCILHSSVNKKN